MAAKKSPKKTVTTSNNEGHENCSLYLTIVSGSLVVMVSAIWYALTFLDKMTSFLNSLVIIYMILFIALIIFGVISMNTNNPKLNITVAVLFVLVMTCLSLFLLILFGKMTGFNIGFNPPGNITSAG